MNRIQFTLQTHHPWPDVALHRLRKTTTQSARSCLMPEDLLTELPLVLQNVLFHDELVALTGGYVSRLLLKYSERSHCWCVDYSTKRPDLNDREDATGDGSLTLPMTACKLLEMPLNPQLRHPGRCLLPHQWLPRRLLCWLRRKKCLPQYVQRQEKILYHGILIVMMRISLTTQVSPPLPPHLSLKRTYKENIIDLMGEDDELTAPDSPALFPSI